MSRPYSADGYFYVYWLKIWLTEGIQLVPGPSIATPLLWYYPHTHPIAFLVAYLFTKSGISLSMFLAWAPSVLYAINIFLIYQLVKVIGFNERIAAVTTLLFATTSFAEVLTLWFSPQLMGSTFLLLSIYLTLKLVMDEKKDSKLYALTVASIVILVLTHHLSTLYFVVVLLGFYLAFKLYSLLSPHYEISTTRVWRILQSLRPNRHLVVQAMLSTYIFWGVYALFIYPQRLFYWIDIVVTQIQVVISGTQAYPPDVRGPSIMALLNLPIIDKLSIIAYPTSIIALAAVRIRSLMKENQKLKSMRQNKLIAFLKTSMTQYPLIIGVITSLSFVLFIELLFSGLGHPVRILSIIIEMFCSIIAAENLLTFFESSSSRKWKFLIVVGMIIIVILSTHWLFRGFQRNVPAWMRKDDVPLL
jgi:hypothetical protein